MKNKLDVNWNFRFPLTYTEFILQDQTRALSIIESDPELSKLTMIQAPLVDMEIRGVPALQFLGDMVWK